MAQQKAAPKQLTASDANEQLNTLYVSPDNASITFEEAFDLLESADEKQLVDLTSDYFTFEKKGETHSFIVEGISEITIKNKAVKVAKVRNREGKSLLIGDKVFVSACERLQQLPAYVRVTYTGDKANANGEYKEFIIKSFASGS